MDGRALGLYADEAYLLSGGSSPETELRTFDHVGPNSQLCTLKVFCILFVLRTKEQQSSGEEAPVGSFLNVCEKGSAKARKSTKAPEHTQNAHEHSQTPSRKRSRNCAGPPSQLRPCMCSLLKSACSHRSKSLFRGAQTQQSIKFIFPHFCPWPFFATNCMMIEQILLDHGSRDTAPQPPTSVSGIQLQSCVIMSGEHASCEHY